jgi:FAD/FMN-containing dehydrogenase
MSDTITQQPGDLAGKTFRRGEQGYEAARRLTCRNVNVPDRFPDIIVQAENEKDVMAAVRLANANKWAIGVRSGGHSWSCNHVRDGGMLLDVSRLNAVTIDPHEMRAMVGPGCRGNQVNNLLAAQKLFFPIGHCEGVGLGGFLLQGGFGWHSRATGVACESVLAIDYVDAEGKLCHASASENAEMYWAARGAGPGFFGVITRFYLKLCRRRKVIGAKLAFYTADHLEEIVRWTHRVGPQVPLSIELMFMVSRCIPFIDGPGIMVVAPVFADSIGLERSRFHENAAARREAHDAVHADAALDADRAGNASLPGQSPLRGRQYVDPRIAGRASRLSASSPSCRPRHRMLCG